MNTIRRVDLIKENIELKRSLFKNNLFFTLQFHKLNGCNDIKKTRRAMSICSNLIRNLARNDKTIIFQPEIFDYNK